MNINEYFKFIDWIRESYKREIYEYEHNEFFTLGDMKKAYKEGKREIQDNISNLLFNKGE